MFKAKNSDGVPGLLPTPHDANPLFFYAGADLAPVATPTDVIKIKAGAKTVYVRRIKVTGAATAAGSMRIVVSKRSTFGTDTSDTLTAVTPVPSATGAAATGIVQVVSVANADAQGTLVAMLGSGRLQLVAIGSAATSGAGVPYVFEPATPIALKAGSTEEITIEGGGSAIPAGGKWDWEVVTEEL